MTNECVTKSPQRGRFNRRAAQRSSCARAAALPSGRMRRACVSAVGRVSASLLRPRATLNFCCYESGGARPFAESLCAVCAEACSGDGKAGDFARGDATSGVAWRISPPSKFRCRRQTRHCSSPPASGALRLSSWRSTAAPEERAESRPAAATWKCVAPTRSACARSTSSTSPRARRFAKLLRPDSNSLSLRPRR